MERSGVTGQRLPYTLGVPEECLSDKYSFLFSNALNISLYIHYITPDSKHSDMKDNIPKHEE